MSLLHNFPDCFTEKKYFRDSNSLRSKTQIDAFYETSCIGNFLLPAFKILTNSLKNTFSKDFTSVVILPVGNIKLYKIELHHRFLEFLLAPEKDCQSLKKHLSSTVPPRDHSIIMQLYFFFFFQPTHPYVTFRNKRCNSTYMLYLTFWNCCPIFYWKTVQNNNNKKQWCSISQNKMAFSSFRQPVVKTYSVKTYLYKN